jgi:hypothetical protein
MVTIKNESTTITVDKTVGEIIGLLTRRGTTSVVTLYDEGKVSGIIFTMKLEYGMRDYKLPVNSEGVLRVLKRGGAPARVQTPDQAARIAWRLAKEWLEVQIALVDAGLARLDEVLMPWALVDETRTMFEAYHENAMKAVTA